MTGAEIEEQIFAPPFDRAQAAPSQHGVEIGRDVVAQPRRP